MPAIETAGLTKRYGALTAVDDVSLTVPEGAIYGLLGPNGAGKSTHIDVLLNFIRPTAGTTTVCGYDGQDQALAVRRRVGVLPDGFDVFPRLSGARHVRYVAAARGVDHDPAGSLARVGLEDAVSQRATDYSRGMQQRLALAMALVGEPDVLILDEPFSGLDPDGVRLLRRIVAEEHDRGATVFLSSHRLDQVERVCTRIDLVRDGRLLVEGPPEELFAALDEFQQYAVTVSGSPNEIVGQLEAAAWTERVSLEGSELIVTCSSETDPEAVRRAIVDAGGTPEDIESIEPGVEALYALYAGAET